MEEKREELGTGRRPAGPGWKEVVRTLTFLAPRLPLLLGYQVLLPMTTTSPSLLSSSPTPSPAM